MSTTAKDAFRLGFLTRCAEEGLELSAVTARLEKVAALNKQAGGLPWGDIAKHVAGPWGLPIVGSALAGGALGYGAAKLTEPALDEDEIKSQELIHTYKVLADRARAKRKLRTYRPVR